MIRPPNSDPIVITVEPVRGAGGTRVIVQAPRSVAVNREEIDREKCQAVGNSATLVATEPSAGGQQPGG